MFLANVLTGIASFFANSISSACLFWAFDEPSVDKDLL